MLYKYSCYVNTQIMYWNLVIYFAMQYLQLHSAYGESNQYLSERVHFPNLIDTLNSLSP